MVSTENERDFAGFERLHHQFGALGAGGGDFFQVFRVGGAFFFLLGDGNGDIAAVFDVVADGFKARFESGDADGRGTHVDAAARLAEVERDADDADVLWSDAGERCVRSWGHEEVSSSWFRVSSFTFPGSETPRPKALFLPVFAARLKARPDTNPMNYGMQKRKPRKILTAKFAKKSCKERAQNPITDTTGATFWGTESFRARVPGRRSRRRLVRFPCRSHRAGRRRTCASPDTT